MSGKQVVAGAVLAPSERLEAAWLEYDRVKAGPPISAIADADLTPAKMKEWGAQLPVAREEVQAAAIEDYRDGQLGFPGETQGERVYRAEAIAFKERAEQAERERDEWEGNATDREMEREQAEQREAGLREALQGWLDFNEVTEEAISGRNTFTDEEWIAHYTGLQLDKAALAEASRAALAAESPETVA